MKKIGFNSIQITLDGDKQTHNSVRHFWDGKGTFDKILENICLCSEEFKTTVRVNISKNNLSEIQLLIERFKKLKIFNITMFFAPLEPLAGFDSSLCYTPKEFAPIQFDLMNYAAICGMRKTISLPIPHFGFCEAVSENNFLFDPDGNHFFCWENVGKKELTDQCANNSSEYMKLYNYFVNTYSFHKSECETCPLFPLCLGGCPQRKFEKGEAPCPPLRYNIRSIIKSFFYLNSKINLTE